MDKNMADEFRETRVCSEAVADGAEQCYKMAYEEGFKIGFKAGAALATTIVVCRMLARGYSPRLIKEVTGMPL